MKLPSSHLVLLVNRILISILEKKKAFGNRDQVAEHRTGLPAEVILSFTVKNKFLSRAIVVLVAVILSSPGKSRGLEGLDKIQDKQHLY